MNMVLKAKDARKISRGNANQYLYRIIREIEDVIRTEAHDGMEQITYEYDQRLNKEKVAFIMDKLKASGYTVVRKKGLFVNDMDERYDANYLLISWSMSKDEEG